jgi:uncharacterized protein (DUF433 family)
VRSAVAAVRWLRDLGRIERVTVHYDHRFHMKVKKSAIRVDPEIMGATPVFVGTRVPFTTLVHYQQAGRPMAEFLQDFPNVKREQAVAALEEARKPFSND